MKDKIILITGGAGFIGSHLCERLVKNNRVICLDNYFTGSLDNHIKNVVYLTGNTFDILSNHYLENIKLDYIYHLGEYSRVEQSFEDVATVMEYNLRGTKSVLEFARLKKAKLIYAGSSTKYADIGKNASPYAWTKATNTELVKNYGEWFGLDYAITYFYNVYGDREINTGKYSTLIAKFSQKEKHKKNLTVVSPGTQTRNFTHIDDTIDALEIVGEFGTGDEYGIGSDTSFSILEIAELFAKKSNIEIEMLPARKGNRMTAPVMSEKTKKLGWKPTRNLTDYIKEL
jgi:UDP-glucose 4-epimerase